MSCSHVVIHEGRVHLEVDTKDGQRRIGAEVEPCDALALLEALQRHELALLELDNAARTRALAGSTGG